MPTPRVIIVGSYMQDLVWRCATFPSAGQTILGQFASGPGGKGSNQAIAAGRAGAPVRFIGAVGRDAHARSAAEFYAANKIAATWITKPRLSTGTAGILVAASGQNEIVVDLGANAALSPRDLPATLFADAQLVITQLEGNLSAVAHTLRTARRAGVATLLNPAPMRADFDPALLSLVDILVPNETEFVALVNQLGLTPRTRPYTEAALAAETPAALHALCRRLGPATLIITLGKRGCFLSTPTSHHNLPAHLVAAVDTTGAGDAFVGGFASGFILHRGALLAAARRGQAVAALSVTKPGAAAAMPSLRALTTFIHKNYRHV